MTIVERHRYILEQLQKNGFVRVADLSRALNVSAVTIRKDLKLLEDRNLLYRSHGSASPRELYVNDRPVNEKETLYAAEKLRIAQAAADMIQPRDTLIIGSGTSVVALARLLGNTGPLTVLTNALNVSLGLLPYEQVEVIQLGGSLRHSSNSVVGPYAEEMIANFACKKLFLGVDGLTTDNGLTTSNLMEAHLNRKMMAATQQTIVLADASKFGRKGFGRICALDEIDVLITDHGLAPQHIAEIEEHGVEVKVV